MSLGTFDVLPGPTARTLRLNAADVAELGERSRMLAAVGAEFRATLLRSHRVRGAFATFMEERVHAELRALEVHTGDVVDGTTTAFEITVATEWEMSANVPAWAGGNRRSVR